MHFCCSTHIRKKNYPLDCAQKRGMLLLHKILPTNIVDQYNYERSTPSWLQVNDSAVSNWRSAFAAKRQNFSLFFFSFFLLFFLFACHLTYNSSKQVCKPPFQHSKMFSSRYVSFSHLYQHSNSSNKQKSAVERTFYPPSSGRPDPSNILRRLSTWNVQHKIFDTNEEGSSRPNGRKRGLIGIWH